MAFNHNDHYHRTVLRRLPARSGTALDVGCGTGRFARRLAAHGYIVEAVDPAFESIPDTPGVRFRQGDITRMDLPRAHYDAITCLASLHHVPFDTVTRLRDALAPGGVLAVLGCYRPGSPRDWAISHAAVPVNAVVRLALSWRPERGERAPVRQPEMTYDEVRARSAELLPGSTLRHLLFWRYLLVWRARS
ncbi:class I SAM-dependent methyltransferase [Kutzneria viridogrisea]|uniref:Methyltransferase type 11 domain-containing protein n=2 Tax=Kutzneria TaxID=43356 RepID=W5WJ17_9PSEU|nr:class I SAM-dependent methyltransferase [Kutzneria albida]AHI00726.1 hypothetical protein KALB_7368 [Kutzneria albida DSM 43870]MBA8925999.1 2-polyprenyl-3-methyl-5-hydroxy-6-metoxy-1,4-benzoquinol methylase [Kutzneria viridogrisea]